MLSSMVKDHQLKQIKKREDIEQKRNVAINSAVQFTSKIVNHLNDGVSQTYINQRKLDTEAKRLMVNIDQFSRSITQWTTLMNSFNDSLKELGDVENWAGCIEKDMREISSILEYVYKDNSIDCNPTELQNQNSQNPQQSSSLKASESSSNQ